MFFTSEQWRILKKVTARTQSESLQMSADFIFEKKMYRLDPDKNRACTRRTVSVRRFFWAPKVNVKKMDKKIFTILCWILSLLSRPRNKGILASSLDLWFYTDGSAVAQWKSAWLETEGPRVRASPASLRCGPWARHIYPSLVLVQPRKTRPYITERLLMERKDSNQANKFYTERRLKSGLASTLLIRLNVKFFYII